MKKIILASASPQRKKLLKILGLKFSVSPSRIKEIDRLGRPRRRRGRPRGVMKIPIPCADLVCQNALLKAQDVASRLKGALVIGADTLVFGCRGELIGKPRTLQEAKKNLKILFEGPSWVYTGLAVVDSQTGGKLVDYEKTKVFMDPLTDREIDRYHASARILDKAGGFDIEGKGGLFIKRIEGCYFNVIGLPLAKLSKMLKRFGVSLGVMLIVLYSAGCATEYNLATQKQETLLYGTDKEIAIGEGLARQFDKNFEMIIEVDVNERAQRILDRIVKVCDRKELVYSIKVIDKEDVNAVSLPGGYIYVYKGLMDTIDNDDQLAGVIGHEVGHLTAKHSMKKLQALYGFTLLQLGAVSAGEGQLAKGLNSAFLAIFTEFSQEDELLADKLGIKYAQKAGYHPEGVAQFLKKLKEKEEKEPAKSYTYWRTHPYLSQRIAAVNKELSGQIEFRDYLNLTGEGGDF